MDISRTCFMLFLMFQMFSQAVEIPFLYGGFLFPDCSQRLFWM